jgi:hypothetical protein
MKEQTNRAVLHLGAKGAGWSRWRAAAACAFVVATARPALAATITVTARQTAPGQGCSFEEAIQAVNNRASADCTPGNGNNDTINIPSNAQPFLASSLNVEIRRSVTLSGAGQAGTVLQWSGGVREGETGLRTTGGAGVVVTIRNLTLRGTVGNQLAGLANEGASVTLSNVRITNFGFAGLRNEAGAATINNSTIDNNGLYGELPLGGGIANFGTLYVTSATISDNFAFQGGGLANFGEAIIVASTFDGNEALDGGGGIFSDAPVQLSLTDSTVSNNAATYGGGIAFFGQHVLSVTSSLLTENMAFEDGGGVFSVGSDRFSNSTLNANRAARGGGLFHPTNEHEAHLFHTTIAANEATEEGGGLYLSPSTPLLYFNLIATNRACTRLRAPNEPECTGSPDVMFLASVSNHGFNLIGDSTGDQGTFTHGVDGDVVGSAAAPVDPQLGALQFLGGLTLVRPLLAGSPAIDQIPPDAHPGFQHAVDQRGFPRPQNGKADMGAFERGPNESILGFELQGAWTSTAPLSLNATLKTQGLFGLNVGGSGYRLLVSSALRTPLLPVGPTLRLDFYVPGNQPNPQWFGAVQAYVSCPSAGMHNAYLGQVELTGKPTNRFSPLAFSVPANVQTALSQARTDCFFSLAVNTNQTPVVPVVDNVRMTP